MQSKLPPNKTLAAGVAAVALAAGAFSLGRVTAPAPERTQASRVQISRPAPVVLPADTTIPADVGQVSLPAPTQPAPPADSSEVWVNTNTGVYHVPGSRWYGHTSAGQYMSEHDALVAGYRHSERG